MQSQAVPDHQPNIHFIINHTLETALNVKCSECKCSEEQCLVGGKLDGVCNLITTAPYGKSWKCRALRKVVPNQQPHFSLCSKAHRIYLLHNNCNLRKHTEKMTGKWVLHHSVPISKPYMPKSKKPPSLQSLVIHRSQLLSACKTLQMFL